MKLSELIEQLEALAEEAGDNDPTVMIAYQPSWPMQENISQVEMSDPMEAFYEEFGQVHELSSDHEDHDRWTEERELAQQQERVVYFAGGFGNNYLQSGMSSQLGWK